MIPSCPTCGQPTRPPLPVCACGHLELGHDLNPKGQRTACFYFDRTGRCPCRHYHGEETPGA